MSFSSSNPGNSIGATRVRNSIGEQLSPDPENEQVQDMMEKISRPIKSMKMPSIKPDVAFCHSGAERAKQSELSGALQIQSDIGSKMKKQISNVKSKELNGHLIFADTQNSRRAPSDLERRTLKCKRQQRS
ncbi:hypothetical protein U9M48_001798 [Paspalum notatum var. saurae]|uniref:DUF4057 domain-containing protein n=1 Tax=Paspalum notatum var. saurae TaxID=547442 RepID=A0AAQ3PP78_PASNO